MATTPVLPEFCKRNETTEYAEERTRELYKYFQPQSFEKDIGAEEPSSKDTVLTSYAQLAAWRLDARRCVISYFDEDTQYNVAEGTKTLFLEDGITSEDPADHLWKGVTSFPVKGSICLYTLPSETGIFEVTDLTKDIRFKALPIVTGPPHMRYYYGTAFKTKKGINIGTVCILDDKSRPPMTSDQQKFLNNLARNVMNHLELLRERSERKRATRMNQCLNLFINPDTVRVGKRKRRSVIMSPEPRKNRTGSNPYPLQPAWSQPSPKKRQDEYASDSDQPVGGAVELTKNEQRRVAEDDHIRVCRKAADLLRTSLDIEGGGGVVFLDTANAGANIKSPRENTTFDRSVRRGSTCMQTPAEVLASSTTADRRPSVTYSEEDAATDFDDLEGNFTPLPVETLATLVDRYPHGKLWVFDSTGAIVSDSESETPVSTEFRIQAEAATLLQHFPHARQVISLPLWDPRALRWIVCFAFSTSKFRTLNTDTDLLYCIAFCNCVTIEMGRLATVASDQLKGDFISSISHELRSPLHGILASCEFLADTEASSFQQSLVHTVSSCARTLLDTISMILDYTKINSFERDWRTAAKKEKNATHAKSGDISTGGAAVASGQPTLNIYGTVDLAAVTEEVVEGVTAGQQHQDILTINFSEAGSRLLPRPEPKNTSATQLAADGKSVVAANPPVASKGKVEVILDIEPRSWSFVTQPGAFRRIVMNLVGNALKYTTRGWIRIHLDIQKNPLSNPAEQGGERDAPTEIILLTVTDTGKGISAEYLRTKLFQAFAQEDHLASGTGLGLSLIRSILKMLNGDIDIVSEVGKGTKVTVRIPMIPQSGSTLSASNTPSTSSSGDSDRSRDDSVLSLRSIGKGKKFTVFTQPDEADRPVINGLNVYKGVHGKIRKYLVDWCRIPLTDWSLDVDADVIITDEEDLPALLRTRIKARDAAILVYCSYAIRPQLLKMYSDVGRTIDFMSKPFGPYKLARALCISLERSHPVPATALSPIAEPSASEIADSFEQPHLVEGKLGGGDKEDEVNILQSGGVLARDDSTNARMAVDKVSDSSPMSSGEVKREGKEFPFLSITEAGLASPGLPLRPALRDRRTMSPTVSEMKQINKDIGSTLAAVTPRALKATTAATEIDPENAEASIDLRLQRISSKPREPRLLLVDDNNINLHLLQTYMKKRKYKSISSANDGLEAVERFEELSAKHEPPDIIFMDISMPVMNGFEATRRIRSAEESANASHALEDQRPGALIIALTGLASGKDQSEAFVAGVDLYMTKPVSFKEVGRLLDNWIRNGGVREGGGVPFGALTGEGGKVVE